MSRTDPASLNSWDDVTALRIPRPRLLAECVTLDVPSDRALSQDPSHRTAGEDLGREDPGAAESGLHRVSPPRISPPRISADLPPDFDLAACLDAPKLLGRDRLASIIASYVACLDRAEAAAHVRETLEGLGILECPVPQALAGHLVLSLAHRIECSDRRSEFLAHAWGILGSQRVT